MLRPGSYTLRGYKWFTSAIDADMSLTLARIADKDGRVTQARAQRALSVSAAASRFTFLGPARTGQQGPVLLLRARA
jgi:hypothetical protein